MSIVFIDGLINTEYVAEYVIGSLLEEEEIKSFTIQGYKTSIFESIKDRGLHSAEIKSQENLLDIHGNIMTTPTEKNLNLILILPMIQRLENYLAPQVIWK